VNASCLRDIRKRPVAVVPIERIRLSGQSDRTTRDLDSQVAAARRVAALGNLLVIERQVVGHIEVHVPVPVIISEGAVGAPVRIADAGGGGDVRERVVAVIAE